MKSTYSIPKAILLYGILLKNLICPIIKIVRKAQDTTMIRMKTSM